VFAFLFALFANGLSAAPADLGLQLSADNLTGSVRIIQGATIPIYADVYNLAATGSDPLNYSLHYTLPGGSVTPTVNGSLPADGGAHPDTWQYDFNSTGFAFGPYGFSATATGQTGALQSPKTRSLTVNVLDHVTPGMWLNGKLYDIRENKPPAQAPSPDFLAFGATGGGESVSLAAPNIIADPLVPTANMDIDSVTWIGDGQITGDLGITHNIIADDTPTAGVPWQVTIKRDMLGYHETIFTLKFSDEDIPGGDGTASMTARIRVFGTVAADGSFQGGVVPLWIPEPSTLALAIGLSVLQLTRRAKRSNYGD
jgi:hypothetical protein